MDSGDSPNNGGFMTRRRRSVAALGLITSCFVPIFSAYGSETANYTYDASGRLVKVSRTGTVNNGVRACYSHDKAINRTNVTVATSDCVATPPTFSVNNAAAVEGSALVFTVTRAGTTSGSYSVSYATSNGSATAGSDYTASSGTLAFATGEITKTVSISTTNDSTVEGIEVFKLSLSNPTGSSAIGDGSGPGIIGDND